jgi:hypothetical protein
MSGLEPLTPAPATSEPLPHSLPRVNTPFCRLFFGAAVRAITPNIALYRSYCCHIRFLNSRGCPLLDHM